MRNQSLSVDNAEGERDFERVAARVLAELHSKPRKRAV
jgi:hypothetical protein